jgi:hypothetical protein
MILILLFLGIPLFEFMVLNSKVSLKYETNELNECLSEISGIDLCQAIRNFHILAIICGLTFIVLLIFRRKIIKSKINE